MTTTCRTSAYPATKVWTLRSPRVSVSVPKRVGKWWKWDWPPLTHTATTLRFARLTVPTGSGHTYSLTISLALVRGWGRAHPTAGPERVGTYRAYIFISASALVSGSVSTMTAGAIRSLFSR